MNEAPHFCDASRVSTCLGSLIPYPDRTTRLTPSQRWVAAPRLERPGIKPGAGQDIKLPVDIIETPQRRSIPRLAPGGKTLS